MTIDDNKTAIESHRRLIPEKRAPGVRLAQRKQISRLLTLGYSQVEIAEHLQLSEATISREVSKLKDSFKQQTTANVSDLQAAELAKLAEVESAAWAQHSKSGGSDALNVILRVSRSRAALLGLDSPDFRTVQKYFLEGRLLLEQAAIDVFGDSEMFAKFVERIEELNSERGSLSGAPADVKTVIVSVEPAEQTAKLSFVEKSSPGRKVRSRKIISPE